MKNVLFLFVLAIAFVQCGEPKATTQKNAAESSTVIDPTDDAPPVDIEPKSVYVRMTNESFKEKMATVDAPQLVDVRTPSEYEAGHIEGAKMVNYKDSNFKEQLASLKRDAPVFVYCQAGGRSQRACNMMKNMGFSKIYELKDGYGSWK